MNKEFEKILKMLEERTSFLSDCMKYGNKDAEQQNKSYSTMMMYEVADLVDDLIEIVKQETEQYNNGWIPCSERLPEEHKQYDITTKNEVGIHSDTAIYNPFLGMWFWDEAESEHIEIEVLAWAEKREPYQPKGE